MPVPFHRLARHASVLILAASASAFAAEADGLRPAAEQALAELERRFIDRHGVVLDYAGETPAPLPDPAQCAVSDPNALGWWTPIENGAFFTGLLLAGLCDRARTLGTPEAAAAARQAAQGLLRLDAVAEVPGFIARGLASDGRAHYPVGSDDQTFPWFYGLWRWWGSGLPTPEERLAVAARLQAVGGALAAVGWQMPSERGLAPRGSWAAVNGVEAPRLLLVLRILHQVSGEAGWLAEYHRRRDEPLAGDTTRRTLCRAGVPHALWASPQHGYWSVWNKASSQAALHGLHALEEDAAVRADYAAGLDAWARSLLPIAERLGEYEAARGQRELGDWRALSAHWRPQPTLEVAVAVANAQNALWEKSGSGRKWYDDHLVREPLFAAWAAVHAADPALAARARASIAMNATRIVWRDQRFAGFFPVIGLAYAGASAAPGAGR